MGSINLSLFRIILVLLLTIPFNTGAQVLEEVIVTAQKREQNLQDVGISVTAFSGEQLENLGATNTTDITQQVPGLQLFNLYAGGYRLQCTGRVTKQLYSIPWKRPWRSIWMMPILHR